MIELLQPLYEKHPAMVGVCRDNAATVRSAATGLKETNKCLVVHGLGTLLSSSWVRHSKPFHG
eukprot:12934203-Prorocentrum_lima.AAC.1